MYAWATEKDTTKKGDLKKWQTLQETKSRQELERSLNN